MQETGLLGIKKVVTVGCDDRIFKKGQQKCPEPESNQRHEDFQSSALPTELSGHNSGGRI